MRVPQTQYRPRPSRQDATPATPLAAALAAAFGVLALVGMMFFPLWGPPMMEEAALRADADARVVALQNAAGRDAVQEAFVAARLRKALEYYGVERPRTIPAFRMHKRDIEAVLDGERPLLARELKEICSALSVSMDEFMDPEFPLHLERTPRQMYRYRTANNLTHEVLAQRVGLSGAALQEIESGRELLSHEWDPLRAILKSDKQRRHGS